MRKNNVTLTNNQAPGFLSIFQLGAWQPAASGDVSSIEVSTGHGVKSEAVIGPEPESITVCQRLLAGWTVALTNS